MVKRLISEYLSFIVILIGILLFISKLYPVFCVVMIIWYFLFGFVGIAYLFSTTRKIKLSNLLILLTLPVFLLPFRKAFYFWIKSTNIILKDSNNIEEAFKFAKQVKIDNLYTDNNKCIFHSFLSSLYFDLNQKELSKEYLEKAKKIPHKELMNKTIEHLDNILNN